MTKRESAFTDEGTAAYAQMVEEMERGHFGALDTSGEFPQCDAHALKEHTDLDTLEAAFEEADRVLENFWEIGIAVSNPVLQMVVSDATSRTRAARRRVREHREEWG